MADERRRLIYELLVEAKGIKEQTDKATKDLSRMSEAAKDVQKALKFGLAGLGLGTLKSILNTSDQFQEMAQQLRSVSGAFIDAALSQSRFFNELKDPQRRKEAEKAASDWGTVVGDALFGGEGSRKRAQRDAEARAAGKDVAKGFVEGWADEARAEAEEFQVLDFSAFNEAAQKTAVALGQVLTAGGDTSIAMRDLQSSIEGVNEAMANEKAGRAFREQLEKQAKEAREAVAEAREMQRRRENFGFDPNAPLSEPTELLDPMEAMHRDLVQNIEDTVAWKNEQELLNFAAAETLTITDGLAERWDIMAKKSQDWAEATSQAGQQLEDEMPGHFETMLQLGDVLTNTFSNLFTGASRNARGFFRQLLSGFAQVFAQLAALEAAASTLRWLGVLGSGLGGMAGGFGGVGAGGGSVPIPGRALLAAYGAVFNRGQLVPFAQGGVVTRPMVFPMASGRVGLMGESGAEAVAPLRRGSDGRLGIAAVRPVVNIHNNTGVAVTANVVGSAERMEIELRAANMGAQLAVARINQSVTSGYGQTAQAFTRSYGLRRRT